MTGELQMYQAIFHEISLTNKRFKTFYVYQKSEFKWLSSKIYAWDITQIGW